MHTCVKYTQIVWKNNLVLSILLASHSSHILVTVELVLPMSSKLSSVKQFTKEMTMT